MRISRRVIDYTLQKR